MRRVDRTDRLEIYAREHVRWAWLVNPLTRSLEVLERADRGRLLRDVWRDGVRMRAEPFDAIEIDLAVLWVDVVLPERGTRARRPARPDRRRFRCRQVAPTLQPARGSGGTRRNPVERRISNPVEHLRLK